MMVPPDTMFKRQVEDFQCAHCGVPVKGNGYTNHCPHCLYSKHVDIHPGDRKAECQGLMEPILLERESGEEKLTHRCLVCGHTKKNRVSAQDNFEALLVLARRLAEK